MTLPKTTTYTRVEDFLCDDDFIRYVMDACPDSHSYWASYLTAAAPIRRAYLKAYDILTHLDDCELLPAEEVARLKQRILHTVSISIN